MNQAPLESLPGMTRCAPLPNADLIPYKKLRELPPAMGRPVVLLATANISVDNIYNNGLFQNVFFIYKLFESIGYLPVLVVQEKPTNLEKTPVLLRSCRFMLIEEIIKQPIRLSLFIEIGMSVEARIRAFMRALGAKIVKLYLGNILNIDIETPMFTPSVNFSHHVVDEFDEIWTSPHYKQHDQYCAAINKMDPKTCKIAPYIWDSSIMTSNNIKPNQWRAKAASDPLTFVIMEPNISIQKNSLIPLLIAEKYHTAFPQEAIKVVIINGDRLRLSPHFNHNILPYLRLFKDDCIVFESRKTMATIQEAYPSAIPIVHHINNEFNYMTLEYLYSGFPVIHNCTSWRDFGYYYPENDINKGVVEALYAARQHADSYETYVAHSRGLIWRHSPYNPEVQAAWKHLIDTIGV